MKLSEIAAAVLAALLLTCCAGKGGNTDSGNGGTMSINGAEPIGGMRGETETSLTTADTAESVTPDAVTGTEPPVTTELAMPLPETTTNTTVAQTTEPASQTPAENGGVTANGYAITAENGITYVNGVLIANKTYALPDTYAPGGLTADTYAAFTEMQSAASAEGLYLFVKSGYRSYIDQKIIYADYAARDGAAAADRYSARAGHSEHQSGMAIDVNSTSWDFADTPEGIWLKENCHLYGFIIRYPEGKEYITGYMYEPWHIRYVGRELAAAVASSGLCLEEYFGITSVYG